MQIGLDINLPIDRKFSCKFSSLTQRLIAVSGDAGAVPLTARRIGDPGHSFGLVQAYLGSGTPESSSSQPWHLTSSLGNQSSHHRLTGWLKDNQVLRLERRHALEVGVRGWDRFDDNALDTAMPATPPRYAWIIMAEIYGLAVKSR